jgi:glycosyltransferase involved in cell wall biosynthesis
MRFLLLNQTFHPDVMATGQYLTELALRLVERGHNVTVVTSRRAYDHPETVFSREEAWRGIRVCRVASTGFGKGAKWRRAADFASFSALCSLRLATLPRHDVVVALTSPPLVSFLGAWLAKVRYSRFFYLVMDFNPDEAIAAGWLRRGSAPARLLDAMSRFSLRRATKVIALDRFMRDRIAAKGIAPEKIAILPPWSHDSEVHFDPAGRERFRKAHSLENKFVVMYSGNHSPCHPLNTVLAAAERLASNNDIAFCFVGGGTEYSRVERFAKVRRLSNVLCLPYQPLQELAGSLSAADLHLVVMGNPFVGLVHPCKIYNIMRVGAPLLYIGPEPSHISEILRQCNGHLPFGMAEHGDVAQVIQNILRLKENGTRPDREKCQPLAGQFSKETLLSQLVEVLEGENKAEIWKAESRKQKCGR